jgi:hypothetical protein
VPREHRVFTFEGDDSEPTSRDVETPAQVQYSRRKAMLANQIRSLYCICAREINGNPSYGTQHMLAWDGDPTGISGQKRKNWWLKIATKVLAIQADPVQFVRAQFYAVKTATPPKPNMFVGDLAVAKYEAYRHQARSDLEHQIASDLNQIQIHLLPFTVNLRWEYTKALEYTLRNQQCGASPLVRYCFAVENNLPVASDFRERALVQYMFQMADYDDVLRNRIPSELKTEAQQLMSSLAGH